jgi:hypothetical protein
MGNKLTAIGVQIFLVTATSATTLSAPDALPDGAFVFIAVPEAGALAEEVYASSLFADEVISSYELDDLIGETGANLTIGELVNVFDGEVAFAAYGGPRFGRTGEADEYGVVNNVARSVLAAEMPADRTDYELLIDRVLNALKDSAYDERDGDSYYKRLVDIKNKKDYGFKYAAVKITEEYETRYAPDEIYNSKEVKDIYIGDNGSWFVVTDEERIFENVEKTAHGGASLSGDKNYSACANALEDDADFLTYVNLDRLLAITPEAALELKPSKDDDNADRLMKEIAGDVRAFIYSVSYGDSGPAEEVFTYMPNLPASEYAFLFGEPTELKSPDAAPAGYSVYVFYSSAGLAEILNEDSLRLISELLGESGYELATSVETINFNNPDLYSSLGAEIAFCYREGAEPASGGQDVYFPDRPNARYVFMYEFLNPDRFVNGFQPLAATYGEITLTEKEGPAGTRFFKCEFEDNEVTYAPYDGWVYASTDEAEVEYALKEVIAGNVLSAGKDFVENKAHLSPVQSTLVYVDYPELVRSTWKNSPYNPYSDTVDSLVSPATFVLRPAENGVKYEIYPYATWRTLCQAFYAGYSPADY